MQSFSHEKNKDVNATYQRRQFSSHKVVLLIVCSIMVSLCAALTFVPFHGGTKAHADSFTEVWSDEFNGAAGTGVDPTNWLYDTGTGYGCAGCPNNWGTGEVETMTNSTSNVYQDGNGHLVIKPIFANGGWTSGRIETQLTNFAAPLGGELEVTASIEQPDVSGSAAAGYWPAFWMLGAAFRGNYLNWPSVGEIDAMEDINGLSSEFGTLHCGTDPGGPCNETTGISSGQRPCSGCQTDFHTYTVIVDRSVSPEQIRWYLDGTNFFTVSANQVDATTWTNAVDHGFFIIFNVAMGGAFPAAFGGGPTAATQSGVPMLVDYVRAYTANGTVTPTPTSTASGSTPTPTSTAGGSTPTPTPTTSGSGFTQGASDVDASDVQFWFQPNGWTAGYVILHYTPTGQAQQNVNMSYDSGTGEWQYTAGGLSPGQVISYSFTYQQNGAQYDTGSYSYTAGSSGSTATPTPTSSTCSGTFNQGANSTSASQAQFWFQPCGWTAGYVILHYTIPGQTQQNVNMSYDSGTGEWLYTADGMSSGQTITYSFTYQQNGAQYDTGSYSWTHP